MGIQNQKITGYQKSIADLPNQVQGKAQELKEMFDARTNEEVMQKHNGLIDQLMQSTKGSSGAGEIGASAISGLEGQTAQALLEALKIYIDEHLQDVQNPHQITATQTGAYSVEETDIAIAEKVIEIGAGDMSKRVYDPSGKGLPYQPEMDARLETDNLLVVGAINEIHAATELMKSGEVTVGHAQTADTAVDEMARAAAQAAQQTATAAQTLADSKVPLTRTVNGKALSANISLTKADVGLGGVVNTVNGYVSGANGVINIY